MKQAHAVAGPAMSVGSHDMDLVALLTRCAGLGVRLEVGEAGLRVHFSAGMPDAGLLEELKSKRDEVLALLRAQVTAPGLSRVDALTRRRVRATSAQRRVWLAERLSQVPTHNMAVVYTGRGSLSPEAWRSALADVVERHEALRTCFEEVDGELWQVIGDAFATACPSVSSDVLDRDAHGRALLRAEQAHRFDLEAGPLIRSSIISYSGDAFALVLNIHHLVCDGASLDILKGDLARAYQRALIGSDVSAEAEPLQFVDYAVWKEAVRSSTAAIDYWQDRLVDAPPVHALPLDYPRPAATRHAGACVRQTLPQDLTWRVREQAGLHGATGFQFLLTAFRAVLHVFSREMDLVTLFPRAGRDHPDLAGTVGMFVDVLPLRHRIEGNPAFNILLEEVRAATIDASERYPLSFEHIVELAGSHGSRAHLPIAQLLFSMQPAAATGFILDGVELHAVDDDDEPAKFDLQLVVETSEDEMCLVYRYDRGIFERHSIERIGDTLLRVIERAVSQPDCPLYRLVAEEGLPPLRAEIGDDTLDSLFLSQARAFPGASAVVADDGCLTYAELDSASSRLARRLIERGVGRGSCVGLYMGRSSLLAVGMLGILRAGAAYVPLDPCHPPARNHRLIAEASARVVLRDGDPRIDTSTIDVDILDLRDVASFALNGMDEEPVHGAGDPAYVIYTSGTADAPKGVVVAHDSVIAMLGHAHGLVPVMPGWRASLWTSISFDVSVYEVFSALCGGATLYVVPEPTRMEPARLFGWMTDHAIQSAYLHAAFLEGWVEHVRASGTEPALKRMLVGVEPITMSRLADVAAIAPDLGIINGYGSTESTVCCTMHRFVGSERPAQGPVPIGHAVNGSRTHVLNVGGGAAPQGAIGELAISGRSLALGYLNRPELTRTAFAAAGSGSEGARLYRTGDLVRCLADGALEFLGRADQQLKLRGFRIEPAEVEAAIRGLHVVRDVRVIAAGAGDAVRLVAYVLVDAADMFTEQDAAMLRRELGMVLPAYMIPDAFFRLDDIPLTVNGKLDVQRLPELEPSLTTAQRAHVAARTGTEQVVGRLWGELLNRTSPGMDDDFFASGGQSLLAVRLLGRIRQHFGLSGGVLGLDTLFAHPTPAAIAAATDAAIDANEQRIRQARVAQLVEDMEEGTI